MSARSASVSRSCAASRAAARAYSARCSSSSGDGPPRAASASASASSARSRAISRRRRLALHGEPRRAAAQLVGHGERGLALAGRAGQLRLDRRRGARAARRAATCVASRERSLGGEQPRERLPGALGARLALDGRDARRLGRVERRRSSSATSTRRIAGVGLGVGELGAHLLEQRRRRLAPQAEPLGRAAQPVEHLHRLLALAGRVGELLLGAAALGEHAPRASPRRRGARAPRPSCARRPRRAARRASRGRARRSARAAARSRRAASRRARPRSPAARAGAAACLHLLLEVARALDLRRDARELQLGAVAARLEAAEAGGLLDQRAPLLRLRGEDRLDLALPDDRVHALAEAEVGEQLDEVEPAHGGLVDEVLALAAAMEPARDRELGEVDGARRRPRCRRGARPRRSRPAPRFAAPAKRTSSGFSARSSLGLSEPAAQRIASATFDLPDPFGPTITPTPGSRRTSTGSGKDLKPRSLTARRCTDGRLSGGADAATRRRRRARAGRPRPGRRARGCPAARHARPRLPRASGGGARSSRTLLGHRGPRMPEIRGVAGRRALRGPRGRPPARPPSSSCPRRRRAARRRRRPRR